MAQELVTSKGSEYNQTSFSGGMNLLGDDSRLQPNEYRIGFNLTNRNDVLDPVAKSEKDVMIPAGLKQEMVTFGEYIIVFIAGFAYYRHYTQLAWTVIDGFKMTSDAPRFWTVAIPVATTNYLRVAATGSVTGNSASSPSGPVNVLSVAAAAAGNLPGLLVQDNIIQPRFIFLDKNNIPTSRVTQRFDQWGITFTDETNTVVAKDSNNVPLDNREYVPIGSSMAWNNGILTIVSQDGQFLYRSVSGRPLDFVVNVVNTLADNTTTPPYTQRGGGDASTTAYSVGVGGITCVRASSAGGWFVSASGANFLVTLNQTPGAPTIFGEYSFNRTFLFNASCLSDRAIMDTLGDTRFIGLTGVRSFNAVEQLQNEGRNDLFTRIIQSAFGGEVNPIVQDATKSACILFNNYELYAMNTIFGFAIAKYDTIGRCWVSFDINQTGGKAVKMFAKIELSVQRLFAITEDDQLYTLYISDDTEEASFRSGGICANILYANSNVRMQNPKCEVQLRMVRAIMNNVTEDCNCDVTPYVNNRISSDATITKQITYSDPATLSENSTDLPDVNTQLMNLLWTTANTEQGWKVFLIFKWSVGSFTQFYMELADCTPMNPPNSQGTTQ